MKHRAYDRAHTDAFRRAEGNAGGQADSKSYGVETIISLGLLCWCRGCDILLSVLLEFVSLILRMSELIDFRNLQRCMILIARQRPEGPPPAPDSTFVSAGDTSAAVEAALARGDPIGLVAGRANGAVRPPLTLHVDPRGLRVGEHLEKLERGDRGLAHCPCIFCSRKKGLFWMP